MMERWVEGNYRDVAAMYEDRHQLWSIQPSCRLQQQPISIKRTKVISFERPSLWFGVPLIQPRLYRQFCRVMFSVVPPLFGKQTAHKRQFRLVLHGRDGGGWHEQELEQLKGWRYVVSLALELTDVLTPLLRLFVSRLSDAVSWLLVTLIGRSLGLVYRGVLQSLGRSGAAQKRSTQQ